MQAPKSYVVRSIGLRKIVECDYNVNVSPQQEKEFYIKQADCPYFRLIRNITGISTKFNPYVVFVDIDYHQDLATIITHLVVEGIRIRGVRFVLGERSASMVRQGVLSFVDASIAPELDRRITMGLDIGETVLSKWQAYRGLVLSSCHCIENYLPKIIVVPDYETIIPNQAIKHLCDIQQTLTNDEGKTFNWTQKGIAESVRDITINAFDGVGIMHESIAAEFERITKSTTHITTCIFRAPFIKGCLHVMDYEGFLTERGVETITDIWGQQHSVHEPMIILTKSMYKGFGYFKKNKDVTDWERYWEAFKKYDRCLAIARANFTEDEENVYTRCNYQILQTLDLPYEEFRHLADDSIEWITRIVSGDEFYTKCFLGLTAGKVKALNDYVAAIAKNDAMMQEPNVRHYLTTLVAKYLDEMKAGKLYIKSCFKFLAPDMIGFLEHLGGLPVNGCMEADEFWTKGKGLTYDGEYLITRNPHICKSENIVLRACKSELLQKWCGHLTNVCMVNIKSITPQKLNGADFDGDLVLVIDDELMLQGVNRNLKSVIDVDDKITAAVEADIVQNRIACILRTTKSMIGEFSNYASAYLNRMPRDEEVKQKYDDYINIISVINGKSIDYAKTGVLYPMPRNISKYGRPLPYFMKYRSEYYARQKLSRVPCNMNKLCWDIEHWQVKVKFPRKQQFDYSIMIDETLTYSDELFGKIEQLLKEYIRESSAMAKYQAAVRKYNTKELKEQFTKSEALNYVADWGELYERYKQRAAEICPDVRVLANIAVTLCTTTYKTKGAKFPWIVAGAGIVQNIKPAEHMRLPLQDDNGEYEYLGRRYTMVEVGEEELPEPTDDLPLN